MTSLPEPISGTIESGPCMVIAFDREGALVIDQNGSPVWTALTDVRVDWRYDWDMMSWVDIGPREVDGDDEEEEASDDRSSEVSGHLPDSD